MQIVPMTIYQVGPMVLFMDIAKRFRDQKAHLQQSLRTMDIRKAECFLPRDREYIYDEIAQVPRVCAECCTIL